MDNETGEMVLQSIGLGDDCVSDSAIDRELEELASGIDSKERLLLSSLDSKIERIHRGKIREADRIAHDLICDDDICTH